MNSRSLLAAAVLCLGLCIQPILAQSEGGNSVGSGGTSGNSGTGSSTTGSAPQGTNGGKNTAGGTQSEGAATNAPTAEFHPPLTSASR